MGPKKFAISAADIRPLVLEQGSCIATDRITVDRRPVGFMYREAPDDRDDSGWRFFAGDESDEYANDVDNLEIYDVNTITNYDPDIIPLLDAPAGSAFARERPGGPLVPVPHPSDKPL